MKAREYAEALYAATYGKDDDTQERMVARMLTLLAESGHTRLLPRIMRELVRVTRERGEDVEVMVRVARSADSERYRARIDADLDTLGAAAVASRATVVDGTAVGGYEVRVRGRRIDRTHKRALMDLYSTLITN
jgi:F0F1-type ATP synthase delta subunit